MKNQLELFCDTQDNTAELSATKSITYAQKLKECQMDVDVLKELADLGLLDKEIDDVDKVFLEIYEEYWSDYSQKNHPWIYDGILLPMEIRLEKEKEYERDKEKIIDRLWPTYVRVATALEILQDQPNYNVYDPCNYVLELWGIYATNTSIEHERAMLYRDFVKCFEGWIKKQREIVTAQYVFNC